MSCRLPNPKLNVGHYHLRAHLSEPPGGQHYETLDGICSFEIVRFDRGSPWGWRPQACAYHEEYAWKKVSAVTELVFVSSLLSNEEYIRERLDPKPGDPYYLHLSDLLLAIREEIPLARVGCSTMAAAARPIAACSRLGSITVPIWRVSPRWILSLERIPGSRQPRRIMIASCLLRSWNMSPPPRRISRNATVCSNPAAG